jgi:hypothetical protein
VKMVYPYGRFIIFVVLAAALSARAQSGDAGPASEPQTPEERLDQLQAENRRLRYELSQLEDERARIVAAMRPLLPHGVAPVSAAGDHAGAPAAHGEVKTFHTPLEIVRLLPATQRPESGAAWNDNIDHLPPGTQQAAQWLGDHLRGCVFQSREQFLARNVHGGRGQIITFEIPFELEKTTGAILVVSATFKEELVGRLAALKETELVPFRGTITYASSEPQAPAKTGPRIVLELAEAEFMTPPTFMKDAQNSGPQTGR